MATTQSWFWFFAGMLSGTAVWIIIHPVWQSLQKRIARPALRAAVAIGATAVLGVGIVFLYRQVGRPDAIAASSGAPHLGASAAMAGGKPLPIEQAAATLAARLERDGGSRDDWMLLAQSYDFLGRSDEAARARERANGPQQAATPPAATKPNPQDLERRTAANPRDVDAWLGLADLKRQQRDYPAARNAYAKVIALHAMTADAWADYADVLGSMADGSLAGAPANAVDRALALEPRHPKALWLKASFAYEQRRYVDALKHWQALRAVMPADSPDLAVIDSNIAETAQLAGLPPPPVPASAAAGGATDVAGTVSIDSRLASRVAPGTTLFIYAKAADSEGPPLAIFRTTTDRWPVTFRLDDSMAMIPSHRLSAFERIVVEARVSRSGQATPAPGDLFVVTPVVNRKDAKALKLVISQEVT
ncbi:MAG TPA: hypothetical protein VE046_12180 [Steroidobacteraceae bacterium]|nr:hypothetical protein [Steroidobacteraceae bacterium]